jgi:hypothetical protein
VVRPRSRWLGDEENALGELKEKRWRRKENVRNKWASFLKKTRIRRMSWSQGVTK